MVNNLPESEVPDVREYIYVDTDRVRSLLAQMSDGLPDEKATTTSRSSRLRLGLRAAGMEKARDTSDSERLSLADLHVSLLEEAGTALGLISDLSDRVSREKFWLRGKVRNQLQPGMLIRVTAPTLLVDPSSIMKTLRGFQTAIGDADPSFAQFLSMIEVLYGTGIALSIRPGENASTRSAFVGIIPVDHGFAPMVHDLLLSRVGPEPTSMTCLVQVARVPTERDDDGTATQRFADLAGRLDRMSGDTLDRGLLDSVISQMGGVLEEAGFAAAPKWPAISVLPLALYRNILPAPAFGDDTGPIDPRSEIVARPR